MATDNPQAKLQALSEEFQKLQQGQSISKRKACGPLY